MMRSAFVVSSVAVILGSLGCQPSDVLSVPPPAGVTALSAYQSQAGAEGLAANGKGAIFSGFARDEQATAEWSGMLGDEFSWAFFSYLADFANTAGRQTRGVGGFEEEGDTPLQTLLNGRVTLIEAIGLLQTYEPRSGRSRIGEAYALIGYAELLAAEDYCAGVPLGRLVSGGVQFGTPLTTDSLLGAAEADFDSALANTNGSDTIQALASVGLARTRLNRGHYAAAATAAHSVPTAFVYNSELQPATVQNGLNAPNFYGGETLYCAAFNVADRKGGNGLNYVSAHDPRLVLDTTKATTCDGLYGGSADSVFYYPIKFGFPSTYVPLATGVEARLIEAEAALKAGQAATWAQDLNALRATVNGLQPLPSDSTTAASADLQVDVMFRERAFWLFGTGTRLGDMRRLIRQYGRDQSTVFPVGPYPNGTNPAMPAPIPNYGTDVDLTLPTPGSGTTTPNPAYRGCLINTQTA